MMQSTKPKIQKHCLLTPWINQRISGLLGEFTSLSLARLCNLSLAAVVASLNSYSNEAECINIFSRFGPKESRRAQQVVLCVRVLF